MTTTLPPISSLTPDIISPTTYIEATPDDSQYLNPGAAKETHSSPPYKRREREPIPIPEFDLPPWQIALETFPRSPIPDPQCFGHTELPNAHDDRIRVSRIVAQLPHPQLHPQERHHETETPHRYPIASSSDLAFSQTPLFQHLQQGLALTTGSVVGALAPGVEECLRAYLVPNRVGMSVGARAWAKHAHRSMPLPVVEGDGDKEEVVGNVSATEGSMIVLDADGSNDGVSIITDQPPLELAPKPKKKVKTKKAKQPEPTGWWGLPKGPLSTVNARALEMFFKIMNGATWRNLHWLPHEVLVYEVRVREGYGMRWSTDLNDEAKSWMFRGFVEPMMENGHELGWKHPLNMGSEEMDEKN